MERLRGGNLIAAYGSRLSMSYEHLSVMEGKLLIEQQNPSVVLGANMPFTSRPGADQCIAEADLRPNCQALAYAGCLSKCTLDTDTELNVSSQKSETQF